MITSLHIPIVRLSQLSCYLGYAHHGQVCFSTERVYVVKNVAERLISLLKEQAQKFPAGGAVTQQGAQTAMEKLVDAEKKGLS